MTDRTPTNESNMSKIAWHPITSDPFEALTPEAQAKILDVLEPHSSRPSSRAGTPTRPATSPVPAPRVGDYIADILGLGLPHPADGGLNPYSAEVQRVFVLDNEINRLKKSLADEGVKGDDCFCHYMDPGFPGDNRCHICIKRANLRAAEQKRAAAFQLALPEGHAARVFSSAEIANCRVMADKDGFNRLLLRNIRLLQTTPATQTPPPHGRAHSPLPTPMPLKRK